MKKILFTTAFVTVAAAAPIAQAADAQTTGLVGGAVAGAIVGGPVGAVIGGAVGLTAGTAIEQQDRRKRVIIRRHRHVQPD